MAEGITWAAAKLFDGIKCGPDSTGRIAQFAVMHQNECVQHDETLDSSYDGLDGLASKEGCGMLQECRSFEAEMMK